MEGPTPVSALIHAATMVTAGVFLVCRMSPVLEWAPYALTFITFIGAATAFLTAQAGSGLDPAYLDQLLGPVALYPDQLLAQILLCAGNSSKVTGVSSMTSCSTPTIRSSSLSSENMTRSGCRM